MAHSGNSAAELARRIESKEAVVAILGLGYVGLPLAVSFARAGFKTHCFDSDRRKVAAINAGRRYIRHIPASDVRAIGESGGRASASLKDLPSADAVVIAVPTPLTPQREPDISHIIEAAVAVASTLRPGQLVSLESTTYPGTTREVLLPFLARSGLKPGRDFFLAYSPEREDPARAGHSARDLPKVVGGLTRRCLDLASLLYGKIVPEVVPVSSPEAAEAAKLTENIFRFVNIGLVNELKTVFDRMGVDIWEVVEAAKTKPFGYMPFYPGPGLGGHCIPIDPYYLLWKAREYGRTARFIELAGEVNAAMPDRVLRRTAEELNRERKSLNGSRILLVGVAYKNDIDDVRESPGLKLLDMFEAGGARVDYHDPHVPRLAGRGADGKGMKSVVLRASALAEYDAVVVTVAHSKVNYRMLGESARLIVDTKNAMAGVDAVRARVVKA
ncbi:MAG: nucleotide sugar dehydrogenase [Planctomycetota bacterium]|jgi:UDP-N-acetyl-D-glucosamine dehydrogenase|nr:nucleotide sugar dehydrogenase [Planctomycetota bacterium]